MDNRQRDRSLYVVQSVVRRKRFDFNSPHVAFVPRQRNLPVVALDSNRQEKNHSTPFVATRISPLLRSSIRPFITLFVMPFVARYNYNISLILGNVARTTFVDTSQSKCSTRSKEPTLNAAANNRKPVILPPSAVRRADERHIFPHALL